MASNRPTLVVISEDPRASQRDNEAMRIALGIVAGDNPIHIVLTGPAVHLLDEDTDWEELAELLTDSYCVQAPRDLAAHVLRPADGPAS